MGEEVQDELLVCLARGVHAHVRKRRGGEQAAQQVECLGAARPQVGGLGVAGCERVAVHCPVSHCRESLGVDREDPVHCRFVLRAEPVLAVVPEAASGHRGVPCEVAR